MIVCADDYGLRDDIDEAILELCHAGRLSAVSCMAVLKRCDAKAMAALLATRTRLEENRTGLGSASLGARSHPHVGLHLTFTDEAEEMESLPGERPNLPPFRVLLRRSLTGRLNSMEVRTDITNQYKLFVQKCGHSPDFIDGHLHAHQLPGIREPLIEFVLQLPAERRPYIRNTAMPVGELRRRGLPWSKAAGIGFFGKRMGAALEAAGLNTNQGFAGIYDFNKGERYRDYFRAFADALSRNGILVVHPGKNEPWRLREFETLKKEQPLPRRN
jgi:hypothetical protein